MTDDVKPRRAYRSTRRAEQSAQTRRDIVMERDTLYGERIVGHVLAAEDSVNIDDLADWERAEARLAEVL